jgi:putative DNA primase/helicase
VNLVLDRLEGVKKNGNGWTAKCPAHNDKNPSLSVSEGQDGRVLVKCWAGCEYAAIMEAIRLDQSDGFARGEGVSIPFRNGATPQHPGSSGDGLILAGYAKAKGLDLEHLASFDLSDISYEGKPAVRIPYFDEDGREVGARFRLALEGDDRFRWRKGSKAAPYGLNRLQLAREAGYGLIVEGESDCHTLWQAGIPALGLPGASTWNEARDASALDGIETIYVVWEPDQGGDTLLKKLENSSIRSRVRLLSLGEHKDVSGLYLATGDSFVQALRAAMAVSIPLEEHERLERERTRRAAWQECQELARSRTILDELSDDLKRSGLVGETKTALIVYLAVVSLFSSSRSRWSSRGRVQPASPGS